MRAVLAGLLLQMVASAALVPDVREAIAKDDFAAAEKLIGEYRGQHGVTAEMILAQSWLGRGALAQKRYQEADRYASEARRLSLAALKSRSLDQEPDLPTALGASVEVHAQALAGQGRRAEGIAFLKKELAAWRNTSIRTRIQKNLNLLALEGTTPPALELRDWLGPKPVSLASLKGKPVLLFFWAHWCGDCKAQAPLVAHLMEQYGPKGLVLVAPTQYYGYVARGEDATPAEERPYIDHVRQTYYSMLGNVPAPLSTENFKVYGVSSTPTLVLIGRNGLVQMYHPGRIPYDELAAEVSQALESKTGS